MHTLSESFLSPPKILVVEDELDIRTELVRELKRSNFEVYEAENGIDALKIAEETIPDLIISDILMPEMNGMEFLEKARSATHHLKATPFLFLSALGDSENILQAYQLGADDYLTKPIDMDVFVSHITAKLNMVQRITHKEEAVSKHIPRKPYSRRELQVLHELCDGKTSIEIGQALNLSSHTVNDYVKSLFRKLEVHSRAEAVKKAIKNKLIDL